LGSRPVGGDIEAHPGDEDAIEKALQNRWKALVPNRVEEDKRFRRQQSIGVAGDWFAVDRDVMVANALLLTQDRIETFRIEVAIINVVTACLQCFDGLPMQSGAEARCDRISVEN
jgi:hypothetical protein